ncbi:MAG: hypothetical protein OEQ53_14085, partial [Saprospiraceae bacterium]|nr:hypothetical protein [Saprospiraceae bacterium]
MKSYIRAGSSLIMTGIRSKVFPFLLLAFTSVSILATRFGAVFLHPNGILYTKTGDGLKNYFLFAYYLKYDQGLRFTGFNYPYGENLLFTDSQPLVVLILNFIDDHLIPLSSHAIALVNWGILFGSVIAVLLIYAILRFYKLPLLYAGVIALAVTFLSPQWSRMHGHLSLSYIFVVPLIWYVTLLFKQKSTIFRALILVLVGVIVGGLHMYFLAMFSLFLLAYWFVRLLQNRNNLSHYIRKHWLLPIVAILPLLFYQMWMGFSDVVADRPISPYGFYTYHANIWSIFLPHYSVLNQLVGQWFDINIEWEGRAYVGFVPLVVCLVSLWQVFREKRLWRLPNHKESDVAILPFIYAGILLLLFSMCIPFQWGLRFIPELITPLKQLRALGRFSWVFFYVINVYAAIVIYTFYKWLKGKELKHVASGMLTLAVLAWAMDGASYFTNTTKDLINHNDKLEKTDSAYLGRFEQASVSTEDFQAVMCLPLVSVRTDKMTFEHDMIGYHEGLKCAYHTGIPVIQSTASRPSLNQSFSNI